MGFLYIIRVERTTLRKIGHTEGSPEKRLADLQIGCPYELILEHTIETSLCREIERLMHAALAQYHKRGEWFDVSLDTIKDRLNVLQEFLVNEALLGQIQLDEEDRTDTEEVEASFGKRRCPHCERLISLNNIRRHMRFCQELEIPK